jgi:hypothetical protein
LEQTLASLRDASPALERAAPERACPPLFCLKIAGIGFAGIFSGNLYIFRLGIPSRAQHQFGKAENLPLSCSSN